MEGSRVVERAGSSGETITFNTLFRATTFDETECCNPASILLVLTHQIPTRHEICHEDQRYISLFLNPAFSSGLAGVSLQVAR